MEPGRTLLPLQRDPRVTAKGPSGLRQIHGEAVPPAADRRAPWPGAESGLPVVRRCVHRAGPRRETTSRWADVVIDSELSFNEWYNDVLGVNMSMWLPIVVKLQAEHVDVLRLRWKPATSSRRRVRAPHRQGRPRDGPGMPSRRAAPNRPRP